MPRMAVLGDNVLYLIDGHAQIFRAYYAIRTPMSSPVTFIRDFQPRAYCRIRSWGSSRLRAGGTPGFDIDGVASGCLSRMRDRRSRNAGNIALDL